jgi:hypothetical protein
VTVCTRGIFHTRRVCWYNMRIHVVSPNGLSLIYTLYLAQDMPVQSDRFITYLTKHSIVQRTADVVESRISALRRPRFNDLSKTEHNYRASFHEKRTPYRETCFLELAMAGWCLLRRVVLFRGSGALSSTPCSFIFFRL